jgi:hypothetical protein
MSTERDTDPPPTDPFGRHPPMASDSGERRTANIFGGIVRKEMAEQLAPVRSTLATIADEQQRQAEELRALGERVSSLESRRQTVALAVVAMSALVLALVGLGAHAVRPHIVVTPAPVGP